MSERVSAGTGGADAGVDGAGVGIAGGLVEAAGSGCAQAVMQSTVAAAATARVARMVRRMTRAVLGNVDMGAPGRRWAERRTAGGTRGRRRPEVRQISRRRAGW
ncbi:hypothetical protein LLS1_30900 [Leifsonia sp. LS1]|nr:hypothetical protein LLS1_30900 [Leifsonia sp. LS1]